MIIALERDDRGRRGEHQSKPHYSSSHAKSLDTWAIFDALGMKIKSAKHEIKRTVIEIGMMWNASPGTMQPSLSSRTRLPGVKVNVEWDDARV